MAETTHWSAASPNPERCRFVKKASIILFARDKVTHVARALRSCFSQTYEPLEILVGDQGSVDGTRAVLYKLISEYKGPHTVKFYDFPDTEYRSFIGMNRHIAFLMDRAEGDAAFVQCADDWSEPNRIEVQMEVLRRTGADMVAGKMQFEEKGEIIGMTGSDHEGWLSMKQIVEDKTASSCNTDWTTDFWHRAKPIPEIVGPDVWLPPLACAMNGVYMHQTPVYTYTRTADANNTGLEGVARGLVGDDALPVVESAQSQYAYAMYEVLTWLAKKGLGTQEQLDAVHKEMMMRLVSMFELRRQLIYRRVDPYRMVA